MKKGKRILSALLVLVMLLTSSPLGGLTDFASLSLKAQALNCAYSAGAAAEYAKQWWNGRNTAIWSDYDLWGGDCANFVCQSLYAGGIPMTPGWYFHKRIGRNEHGYTTERTESFTVVTKMSNYLQSIGGQYIERPSASQVSIGDVMIYNWENDGEWDHCGICTDIINGVPQIACHTSNSLDTNWIKGAYKYAVIKMGGATCTNFAPSYDVYIVTNEYDIYQYEGPSKYSGRTYSPVYNDYILHVTEQQYDSNGTLWGKCKVKGVEGWVNLSGNARYITRVNRYHIDHSMGPWRVKVEPTCTTVGVEERICSKCGYTQTRNMTVGGKHRNVIEATCLNPAYCTACGKTIGEALGHDFDDWKYDIEPTCTKGGTEKRICMRCGYTENRDVEALGHDYAVGVTGPNCVNNGTYTYVCSRCSDSYIGYQDENNTWSDWTTDKIDLPSDKVQTKTQYRSRTKETTTSSSSKKDGWTLYKTTYKINWNGAVNYFDNTQATNETYRYTGQRSVDIHQTYLYRYRKWNPSIDWYDYKTIQDSGYEEEGYWVTSSSVCNYDKYGSGQALYMSQEVLDASGGIDYPCWKGSDRNYTKTQYGYQSGTKIYTYHFYKWKPWTSWQDTEITGNDLIETESRTVYRYDLAALGHDPALSDEKNYYEKNLKLDFSETGDYGKCYWRGEYCQREGCGAHLDTENYNHAFPVFNADNIDLSVWIATEESTDELTVYKAYCSEGCGCYVIKTKENCVFEYVVTPPTCTEDGHTDLICTVHGNCKYNQKNIEIVPALGHECDEQWEITKYSTCTEAGEETSHCIRFDNGETCDKVYTREISPIGHELVKTDAVAPTCTEEGNIEYYSCAKCSKYFSDKEAKSEIEKDSCILTPLGHELYDHDDYDENGKRGWYWVDCTTDRRDCQREGCTHSEYRYDQYNHDFEVAEIKSPTCTNNGYTKYKCTICGLTYSKYSDSYDHIQGESHIVYPTCTTEGYSYWVCQREGCLEKYSDGTEGPHIEKFNIMSSTGHALSPNDEGYEMSDDKMELINSVKSTCGNGTIDTYQCTHINKNNGERCLYTVTIGEDKDHNLSDYIIIVAPTCEKPGKKVKKCLNEGCDYKTEAETIPPIGHDWAPDHEVKPTCEENGGMLYVCRNDSSHTYMDESVPAFGHNYGDFAFDGEEAKTHTQVCANDETHKITENCTFTSEVTKKATCTEDGERTYTCSVCRGQYTEVITARKHSFTDWHTTKTPTCTEKGVEQRECKNVTATDEYEACRCVETREIDVDKNNHELIHHEAKAPTCEEDGYFAYDECIREGCDYTTYKVDPALKHNYGDFAFDGEEEKTHTQVCANDETHKITENCTFTSEVTKKATCTEDGERTYTCSVCRGQYTEVITARKHSFTDWHTTKTPTCTEKGVEQRECKNVTATDEYEACRYVETREIDVDKNNHDWGEITYTWSEDLTTCTALKPCKRNHNHDIGEKASINVKIDNSTCVEDGLKTYTADFENEVFKQQVKTEVIPKKGHTLEKTEAKDATCLEDGNIEYYTCMVCGKIFANTECKNEINKAGTVVNALGHDYSSYVANDDFNNYTKIGTHTMTCQRLTCTVITENHTVTKAHTFSETERKEATTTIEGYIKYICYDCGFSYTQELDKVIPSDLEEEKKSINVDGKSVITLSASAATSYVNVITKSQKPVDVVLVLDQSGSMSCDVGASANETTRKNWTYKKYPNSKASVLIDCANNFIGEIYNNYCETGAEHRVALVGFAYGEDREERYTNTGILATNNYGSLGYLDAMKSTKKCADALISIKNTESLTNSVIANVKAKGATAADKGLALAESILASGSDDNREKIIVFITDGVPTYSSLSNTNDVTDCASKAIEAANEIKNTVGAKIYAVAVDRYADTNASFTSDLDGIKKRGNQNLSYDINRFLHIISSNYNNVTSMDDLAGKTPKNGGYYMSVRNTEDFAKVFSNVLINEVARPELFDKVTLFDTLSENVTLTLEDERAMRDDLTTKFGMRDEDIIVTRDSNGTTRIEFHNVMVKKVDGKYIASVTFKASLNENALDKGKYDTNTADAGVQMNDVIVKEFKIPQVTVEADRHIVVYTINGEVYLIMDYNLGDDIEVPATEVATWNVDGKTVTKDVEYIEAESISNATYTVTWNMNGETVVNEYRIGDEITAPTVTNVPDGKEFAGWTPSVTHFMPNYNLVYTAIYDNVHVHDYTIKYVSNGDGTHYEVKTCACSEVICDIVNSKQHSLMLTTSVDDSGEFILVCSKCGTATGETIKVATNSIRNSKVLNLNEYLEDAEIEPNENGVVINVYTGKSAGTRLKVTIVNADGSTESNATVTVNHNGYITFIAPHFSYYVLTPVDESGKPVEEISFGEIYCAENGHTYTDTVTAPTCTENGYTTHTCTVCGDSYKDSEIKAKGHTASGWIIDKAETCTISGSKHKECTACYVKLENQSIPATGHSDGNNDGYCDNCETDLGTHNPSESCACSCHKTGIVKFFWQIINFFHKIFGMKQYQYCSCGIKHW